MRLPITPTICALAVAGASTLAACDSCGCHAPPVLGDAPIGLLLGLFEQYTDFSTLKTEGEKVDNPTGQWMHSSTTQVKIGYAFTPAVSLTVFVPYVSRSYQRPNNGVTEHGTVAGLGDMSALGSVRIFNHLNGGTAASATLQAGIKAPTGDPSQLKTERDGGGNEDPDNAVGGHDLNLGSGSWDYLVGGNAIAQSGRAFVSGQVMYTYHTEGAYQYRIANEISATGSVGYAVWKDDGRQMDLQANIIGDSKGLDRVAGEETTDTANHNVYVGPEVNLRWKNLGTAMVGLDLPIVERNSDTQLVPTWRIRAALGWRF